MKLRTIRIAVIALSVAWFAAQVAVPGRFPQGDEAIFKEPGYQLATTGRMTAPPFKGFFELSPDISEVFAIYQPLYSWGYAGWLAVFPHTFRAAVAYDAVIHLALVAVIMFGLPRMLCGFKPEWAAAVAAIYNFMGTSARPDELAMVFGYAGLVLWLIRTEEKGELFKAVAAGVLLGLCGATSMPALLILMMWAGIIWLCAVPKNRESMRYTAVVGITAAVSGLVILVPFYLRDGALAQYRQHAQWFVFAGIVRSLREGSCAPFRDLLVSGFHTNIYMYPLIGILVVAGLVGLVGKIPHRTAYLAVLAVYAFIFISLPQQTYYYWFLIPVLTAATVSLLKRSTAACVVLALALAVGGNRTCRDFVKLCGLPPEQSLASAEKTMLEHVPRNARLMINPASYFVARRSHENLYVKRQEMPELLSEVDYCAWSSWWLHEVDGVRVPAGMLSRSDVRILKREFDEIHNGLPSTPPALFGVRLGHEPRGFGMVIYGRTTLLRQGSGGQAGRQDHGTMGPRDNGTVGRGGQGY